MARRQTDAVRFVLRAVAGSLGFFGLLRLTWIEAHVVLPFTRVQSGLAVRLFGAPTVPVEATLACSGADALALCLGAILAYPVRWRTRLAGAGCGVALIVGLNTLRIGTLGRVADVAGVVQRRSTSMSGPPCSRWRSPDMCSRGCASRIGARP